MNKNCEYCGGVTPDDKRGMCSACGAPRKHIPQTMFDSIREKAVFSGTQILRSEVYMPLVYNIEWPHGQFVSVSST
jgi:hypothetical protein